MLIIIMDTTKGDTSRYGSLRVPRMESESQRLFRSCSNFLCKLTIMMIVMIRMTR